MRYQPIFHTSIFDATLRTRIEYAALTTVIEMVEILDGRVAKRSVERNLLHLVIVKYGVILLVVCISNLLLLVKILMLLLK